MWPVSREHSPKHFLPLIGEKSLFQINYEGLRTHFKPEEIYVSTNKDQMEMARQQEPEIPEANFILEPEMRNQGPATGLIAAILAKEGKGNEPFMIVQADVLREPVEKFIEMMEDCDTIAKRETKYITGGFRPDFPVMGVDYLVKGSRVTGDGDVGIYNIDKFVWRGSKEQTEEFIKQPTALVHANHTCMTPNNLLPMLQKYKPEWYGPLAEIVKGANVTDEYAKMEPGPIEDVTQKVYEAGDAMVVELPFKWVDFGTFESLDKYLKEKGLYKAGNNVVDLNGKSNFVKLDDPNKVVALVGVDNLIVVDTGDALLVCDKSKSGDVGEARAEVQKREIELT